MRTSRVAKETSKFFKTDNAGSLPQRRSTRSSTRLARFANTNGESSTTSIVTNGDDDHENEDILGYGSDIEDAIITKSSMSPPPSTTRAAKAVITGKRKRATTTTAPPPPPPSRRTKPTAVKKQEFTPKTKLESNSEEEEKKPPAPETKTKPRRTPARRAISPTTGMTKVLPPSSWEEMYRLVKEMRISGPAANAAVDTMGCERLASREATPRDRRFHTLVALMLSSQTKDTVNAEAMIRLKKELPACEAGKEDGLNLENMLAVEPGVLNELIGKVGFHNNKTKYLKQAAVILRDQHNSDIPPTLEGLMSLPGVGPKMAHLCMGAENGWNTVTGIGVDVHVHRITNLWGWQAPPSKNPEETRMALESWLPRDKWKEINWLLVGFGQKVCLPVGRKCGDCTLGLKGLCKSADRGKVIEGRRRLEMGVKVETQRVAKGETQADDGDEDVKRVKKEEGGGIVISREAWLVKESMEEDGDVKMVKEEEQQGNRITPEAWKVKREENEGRVIIPEAWRTRVVDEEVTGPVVKESIDEDGDVKMVKNEENGGNIITREAWVVKESIEEDDEELSFVKRQVKEEAAGDMRGVEDSEALKEEDSSFVKIKDESDEEIRRAVS